MAAEPSVPAANPSTTGQRYHSLDFLRGALMLLGVLFHAAIPIQNLLGPDLAVWPDSRLLAILVVGSHGFRMPLFFILAGFFGALLASRRSPVRFAGNRLVRIALPLVAGWAILSPFVGAGLTFSLVAPIAGRDSALDLAWGLTELGNFYFLDSTMHLWFLYYLLIYYAAVLVLIVSARRWAEAALERTTRVAGALLGSPWRLGVLTAATLVLLYVQPLLDGVAPDGFTPEPGFTLLYGAFFGFGCLLFATREHLATLRRFSEAHLTVGVVLVVLYTLAVEEWFKGGTQEEWKALATLLNAVMIWTLFFGLTGVALRYLERPIGAVRYVSDASYWFYLIHLPLTIWLNGFLAEEDLSPELQLLLVVSIVTVICAASYELLVRWTYIGTVLNGRRYPPLFAPARRRSGRA